MPASQGRAAQGNDANLLLVVGQLLESARATSDAVKAITEDGKQRAATLIAMAATVETLETTVADLNRVVRTGAVAPEDALTFRLSVLSEAVRDLKIQSALLVDRVGVIDHRDSRDFGAQRLMERIGSWVLAILTLGIALYAALKGK